MIVAYKHASKSSATLDMDATTQSISVIIIKRAFFTCIYNRLMMNRYLIDQIRRVSVN